MYLEVSEIVPRSRTLHNRDNHSRLRVWRFKNCAEFHGHRESEFLGKRGRKKGSDLFLEKGVRFIFRRKNKSDPFLRQADPRICLFLVLRRRRLVISVPTTNVEATELR